MAFEQGFILFQKVAVQNEIRIAMFKKLGHQSAGERACARRFGSASWDSSTESCTNRAWLVHMHQEGVVVEEFLLALGREGWPSLVGPVMLLQKLYKETGTLILAIIQAFT